MAPPSAPLHLQLTSQNNGGGGEFIKFHAQMRLPLAPVWASKGDTGSGGNGQAGLEGVREVLAGWVMRYLPPLRCVLLTFSPSPSFDLPTQQFPSSKSPFSRSWNLDSSDNEEEEESAENENGQGEKMRNFKCLPMIEGSGFSLPVVRFEGMGWRPRVGQVLTGSPILSTPSHISLLLHNLFNCSIPSSHIPSDTYYFDPDYPVPLNIQNRQNWGLKSEIEEIVKKVAEEDEEEVEGEEEETEEMKKRDVIEEEEEEEDQWKEKGWWRRRDDDSPVGGEEGRIEFTVVGLTIANSLITLTGSLLPSPFSIPAPPPRGRSTSAVPSSRKRRKGTHDPEGDESSEDDEESSKKKKEKKKGVPPKVLNAVAEESEDENEEEESEEEESDGEEETMKMLLSPSSKDKGKGKEKEETKEEKKKRKEEKKKRKEERDARRARKAEKAEKGGKKKEKKEKKVKKEEK